MFETLLESAHDSGGEIFVFMKGFPNPLKGRIQALDEKYFTFFQNGKQGTVLWAFKRKDMISCGLIIGSPFDAVLQGGDEGSHASTYSTGPDEF